MKIKELNCVKIKTMISDRARHWPRIIRRGLLWFATKYFIKKYKIRYRDIEIVAPVSTHSDLDRAMGGYEKFVVDQIYDSLCVDNNQIVYYEIGACTGIISLIVSKLIKDKKGTCVAFEPSPANINTIAKSVLENDIKNIILIPFAISNDSNLSKLYLAKPKISSGQGGHSLRYLDYHKESHFIRVPKMSLDDAIKLLKLPAPTFVSLDVESHEEEVLEGMEELLSHPRLKNIIIEINGTRNPHGSKVTDILKKAGYDIKDYKASGPRAVVHCMVNYEKTGN